MSDWDSVTFIRKSAPSAKTAKSSTALNSALRSGAGVTSTKKSTTNSATARGVDGQHLAKLDRETEDFHIEKVNTSVAKAIQQGRQAKNMTQKELATKINEKATVVNEYEAGKAIPNQQVLGKLERALGIKLRGKDIGAPLAPRGAK